MHRWEYCSIDTANPTYKVARFSDGEAVREEEIPKGTEHTLRYMAALGAQGWELVGVEVSVWSQTDEPGVPDPDYYTTSGSAYWFKRPLP